METLNTNKSFPKIWRGEVSGGWRGSREVLLLRQKGPTCSNVGGTNYLKEELNTQEREGIFANMKRFRRRYDPEQRLKNRKKTENRTPPPLGREKSLEI